MKKVITVSSLCLLGICSFFVLTFVPQAHSDNMTVRTDIAPKSDPTPKVTDAAPSAPTKKALSLQEELAQNPQYILATNLLNATIHLLETRITPEQHKRLKQWQKKWKDSEQAEAIARLSKSMPITEAYIKATEERTAVLLRIAAVVPASASYVGTSARFSTAVQDGVVTVQGSAHDKTGKTSSACTFQGLGALQKGWIQISNQSALDFYVLFTPKAAYITHLGSPKDMGCLNDVDFTGAYIKE